MANAPELYTTPLKAYTQAARDFPQLPAAEIHVVKMYHYRWGRPPRYAVRIPTKGYKRRGGAWE